MKCSTVQFTTVKTVQGISSFEPSKTCLLAALLCNMTVQYWSLCFRFLKRSSHIWSECVLISVLKPYGTLEGRSRVKMGFLAHA